MDDNEILFTVFDSLGIPTVALIIVLTYGILLLYFLRIMRNSRVEEEKKFINALSTGITNGVITEFSDVVNIYKGVRKATSGNDENSKARLATWLRAYLLSELESSTEISNTDQMIATKNQVTAFIEKAEKESPHALLPDLERNVIRDIESYLGANDNSSVKRKIGELSTAIQIREEALGSLQSTTKWSVPLSIFGFVLTVIFGILSIF